MDIDALNVMESQSHMENVELSFRQKSGRFSMRTEKLLRL
nr:MAG TPA: hypothetical protein [Caudoviricetes sp.]